MIGYNDPPSTNKRLLNLPVKFDLNKFPVFVSRSVEKGIMSGFRHTSVHAGHRAKGSPSRILRASMILETLDMHLPKVFEPRLCPNLNICLAADVVGRL